jgi:hypothetical protein
MKGQQAGLQVAINPWPAKKGRPDLSGLFH